MPKLLKDNSLQAIWQKFLEENYKSEIETLALSFPQERSLLIDYEVLDKKDLKLAEKLLKEPYKYIYNAEFAIKEIDTVTGSINPHIRVINLPDICKKNIRDLRSEHMGKIVTVEGIIKKHTTISPDIKIAAFQCDKCGTIIKVEQTEELLKEPSECYEDQGGCGRASTFKLLTSLSAFLDGQKIQLQENPEGLHGGQQPEKITIILSDDIVGKVHPGDRIKINGILHGRQRRKGSFKLTSFKFIMEAISIEINKSLYEEIHITDTDKDEIIKASKNPLLFQQLTHSIAPSIYGMDGIKDSLVLQLFGGLPKELPDETRIRGDINILLIGDPGVAKSQVLNSMSQISPRSIFCTGKGVSAAGLTASVIRDQEFGEGNWTLEAGALVLADQGIACIDELDKMGAEDRSALHPAMEQQEIHISKAGINATLKTRCSVLAAANPKLGKFDEFLPFHQQIDLPIPLISRFDLIFAILDKPNEKKDSEIATHIINLHQNPNNKTSKPDYSKEFLSKYIAYAKQNIHPKITDEIKDKIKEFYINIRNISDEYATITPRQLESIIRLSEASAKSRLSKKVTHEDVDRAISIMDYYLKTMCVDFETGKLDISKINSGYAFTQQERMKNVLLTIQKLTDKNGYAEKQEVIQELEIVGIPSNKTETAIDRLLQDKRIFEITPGRYKLND